MRVLPIAAVFAFSLWADELSNDELKMLRDPGGWEYLSMSDAGNGFPTQHTCFDGTPHPDECQGRLTLGAGGAFQQVTTIRGQSVRRTGRYQLDGKQLTFTDEFGTPDGPYTLDLDLQAKSLKLDTGAVHLRLLLESEYKEQQRQHARH